MPQYALTITFASLVVPKRAFNWFNIAFLERVNVTQQGISILHNVVYSVNNGCSLLQKSIHHKRENTILFSSIQAVNG